MNMIDPKKLHKFRKPNRKICELCFKKRKLYANLRFGQLWRSCCRKCYKEYAGISDEYQFVG